MAGHEQHNDSFTMLNRGYFPLRLIMMEHQVSCHTGGYGTYELWFALLFSDMNIILGADYADYTDSFPVI